MTNKSIKTCLICGRDLGKNPISHSKKTPKHRVTCCKEHSRKYDIIVRKCTTKSYHQIKVLKSRVEKLKNKLKTFQDSHLKLKNNKRAKSSMI